MSKVSILAKLPLRPGTRDEFVAAFSQMFPVVDGEEGTLIYTLHLDAKDEDLVWVYEMYASDEALAAHSGSDGMKAGLAAFGGFIAGPAELIRMTPVGGKGLDTSE
jgi:quinol monooxygenase YgiN